MILLPKKGKKEARDLIRIVHIAAMALPAEFLTLHVNMRRDKTRILLTDHIPLPRRYKRGHGDARKLRPRECRAVQHHAGLLPLGDRINEPVGKPVGRFQSRSWNSPH